MHDDAPGPPAGTPAKIDTSVPHSARICNYWLGGKDHYEVDRAAGERYREIFPDIVVLARQSRYFLARAVRYLVREAGIRQFLDIGTGLPTVDNTHEVAQRAAPESRVVYVDNDPLVLAHARALLTSTVEGATAYVDADLREPEKILREAARTLDLARPVAVLLVGILGHIDDDAEARPIVSRLLAGVPSGSYLVIAAGTTAVSAAMSQAQREYNDSGAAPYHLRSQEQIERFFDGLELVEPGVVSSWLWRPEVEPISPPPNVGHVCGVGRKS